MMGLIMRSREARMTTPLIGCLYYRSGTPKRYGVCIGGNDFIAYDGERMAKLSFVEFAGGKNVYKEESTSKIFNIIEVVMDMAGKPYQAIEALYTFTPKEAPPITSNPGPFLIGLGVGILPTLSLITPMVPVLAFRL